MEKKTLSKPMKEILTRLEEFEYIKTCIFTEKVILEVSCFLLYILYNQPQCKEPVEKWPLCDCLISFHSKGFPLEKSITYANLRKPLVINNLESQFVIQDRREVYRFGFFIFVIKKYIFSYSGSFPQKVLTFQDLQY